MDALLQFEKHFTPVEASRTLPLVRRIVEDIQEHGHQLNALKNDKELSADERKAAIERQMKTVNSFFKELEELGCYYKGIDFEIGMVDFPGIIDDEEVFLCWKSDEDEIRWYHGLGTGFKGRREIPQDLLPPDSSPSNAPASV